MPSMPFWVTLLRRTLDGPASQAAWVNVSTNVTAAFPLTAGGLRLMGLLTRRKDLRGGEGFRVRASRNNFAFCIASPTSLSSSLSSVRNDMLSRVAGASVLGVKSELEAVDLGLPHASFDASALLSGSGV